MLNPQKPWHVRLGRFLFRLPHNQRKWQFYMARYYPIMEPAFKHNEAARLLVLRVLRQFENNKLKQAAATVRTLKPYVRQAEPADQAMFGFLYGLGYETADNHDEAIRCYRWANKFNHRYFLPYLLAADYDVNSVKLYSRATVNYQTTIDCIYEYPPLTDITKHALCIAYSGLCFCHVMMHKYDIAKADLLHAEQMESENHFALHARIYLHAALRQSDEVAALLPRYKLLCPEEFDAFQTHIERILAEQDSHFTQMPIGSPDGINAFWQNFQDKQFEMMQLIRSNRRHDARELALGPLREMDCYRNDFYGFDVMVRDGQFTLYLHGIYSRTYTPWVDAILAACPEEIRANWHIISEL